MFELKDLILISCGAVGHYTGNEESTSCFMPNEMYNEYTEEIDAIKLEFGDLDGKHAHVTGDTEIVTSEKGKILHLSDLDDENRMIENLYGIVGEENADILYEINRKIAKKTDVEAVIKVTYNGKEYTV